MITRIKAILGMKTAMSSMPNFSIPAGGAASPPHEPSAAVPIECPAPMLRSARQLTPAIRKHEAPVISFRPTDAEHLEETMQPIQYTNTSFHDGENTCNLTAASRFSEWFEDAINQKREENPGWAANNLGNWRSTKKLFIDAHGDRPMGSYTKAHLSEFRSVLCALPKHHHKRSDAPGLLTIIDEAEAEEAGNRIIAEIDIVAHDLNPGGAAQRRAQARVPRIRVATAYRHMQAIQFVFRHAADQGAALVDAMKGVIWTADQLDRLKAEEKN